MTEQEKWINLEYKMRALQKSEGWDAFCEALDQRMGEAFEDMLKGGKDQHDLHTDFIEGLRWVLGYPQTLVARVRDLPR